MILTSLGRVAVTTSGTPVPLSSSTSAMVARVVLQTAPSNTGKIYFGSKGLNKTTLAGVSRVLATVDSYEIATEDGTDGLSLAQLAIDADVSGEGVLVSYWTE